MRSTALLIGLFCFYMVFEAVVYHIPGLWEDDGVYMATAKSLAAGTGYRHIELPGQPWQTKYPILYPAVLAGAFLLRQEYPQELACLMLPGRWLRPLLSLCRSATCERR